MRLDCWSCLRRINGVCKQTRKDKKECKKIIKEGKIEGQMTTFVSFDLGTVKIKIDKGESK
ncbi:MAG: hypothetical protein IKI95_08685 [Clostridia bacterium]|nr:hypothetical protein [Clostridia bacterium]